MDNKKWVTSWGNAISIAERRPENYAKELTLRYPVKMMLSGEKIRITLDNFCGHEKVILTKATAAKSLGGDKISAETIVPITFRGAVSTDIPAGEKAVSDAIELSVNRGEEIAVSLYFKDFTEMRSGVVITGPLSQGTLR